MDSIENDVAQTGLSRRPCSTPFVKIENDHPISEREERWVRTIDDRHWISALYRFTGFGYYEWETALCIIPDPRPANWPDWRRYDALIIAGDRREELAHIAADEMREWYAAHIEGNRNSMETVLHVLSNNSAQTAGPPAKGNQ